MAHRSVSIHFGWVEFCHPPSLESVISLHENRSEADSIFPSALIAWKLLLNNFCNYSIHNHRAFGERKFTAQHEKNPRSLSVSRPGGNELHCCWLQLTADLLSQFPIKVAKKERNSPLEVNPRSSSSNPSMVR